jgi:TetR/AcrR family transcriptional regulator, mexCD-oprJ operon repressor
LSEPLDLQQRAVAELSGGIARGQVQGEFRTDLPRSWLVATFSSLMHSAAEEVDAGRLDPDHAAGVLTATLQVAFATPASHLTLGPAAPARCPVWLRLACR